MSRRLLGSQPYLTFGTIATAALMLATCSGDEAIVLDSFDGCFSRTGNADLCNIAMDDAKKAHLATAPRYVNMIACEMDYGARNCTVQDGKLLPNNPSGQSVISPRLAGFYLPPGLRTVEDYYKYRKDLEKERNESRSSYGSGTLYRKKSGELVTPNVGDGVLVSGAEPRSTSRFNAKTHVTGRSGFGGHFFSGG